MRASVVYLRMLCTRAHSYAYSHSNIRRSLAFTHIHTHTHTHTLTHTHSHTHSHSHSLTHRSLVLFLLFSVASSLCPSCSLPHAFGLACSPPVVAGRCFGFTINALGFKVIPPYVRVIQGDGVNLQSIAEILGRLKDNGCVRATRGPQFRSRSAVQCSA